MSIINFAEKGVRFNLAGRVGCWMGLLAF